MLRDNGSRWMMLCGMLGIIVAWLAWTDVPAQSQTSSDPAKRTVWEYRTLPVEANALPSKLETLGNDGWKVFSIVRSDLAIEQEAGGTTHLRVVTYEVTARRPKRE